MNRFAVSVIGSLLCSPWWRLLHQMTWSEGCVCCRPDGDLCNRHEGLDQGLDNWYLTNKRVGRRWRDGIKDKEKVYIYRERGREAWKEGCWDPPLQHAPCPLSVKTSAFPLPAHEVPSHQLTCPCMVWSPEQDGAKAIATLLWWAWLDPTVVCSTYHCWTFTTAGQASYYSNWVIGLGCWLFKFSGLNM